MDLFLWLELCDATRRQSPRPMSGSPPGRSSVVARETLSTLSEVEHHATWALTISVDPDECDGGFVASCAEVAGAMGQGDTEEEAARDLLDAVSAIAEVRLAETFEVARERADDGPQAVTLQL